jgi:hypothetical protein
MTGRPAASLLLARQAAQDRAVGPLVAGAGMRQLAKRIAPGVVEQHGNGQRQGRIRLEYRDLQVLDREAIDACVDGFGVMAGAMAA